MTLPRSLALLFNRRPAIPAGKIAVRGYFRSRKQKVEAPKNAVLAAELGWPRPLHKRRAL